MKANDFTSSHHCRCSLSIYPGATLRSLLSTLDILQQPTVGVSLFCAHVPSPAELMGEIVIMISAPGQRCVALRLFWKNRIAVLY